MKVSYNSLPQQFSPDLPAGRAILQAIEAEMRQGRWTLGPQVQEFEERWAAMCGTKYAVGVASGTDALFLILKALNQGGRAIITVPNTFLATVGAILQADAIPVLTDIDDAFLMASEKELRPKYPPAIGQLSSYPMFRIPVHWGGDVATSHLAFIEDACQAVGAEYNGRKAGSLGTAAAFSLHPLKNINVMGDGGMVTTNDEGLAKEIALLRNHGLADRNTWIRPAYNMRLSTIQAIVGLEVMKQLDWITEKRRENAAILDEGLQEIPEITVPIRNPKVKHVYHLYQVLAERRDELMTFLETCGIENKIHYPVPLHLQPALKYLGYQEGDFPMAEKFANEHITLPVHQYLEREQMEYIVECVAQFYRPVR